MQSNLFTDLDGTTNPQDRKPKKSEKKFFKFLLKASYKTVMFFVKYKKVISFLFNSTVVITLVLILKKIIYTIWSL